MFKIKDINLAPQGELLIELAERRMAALLKVRQRLAQERPFAGVAIGLALHVTKETAVLVQTLIAGGAEVAICSCNPLSTQDEVAAALAEEGVNVFAWRGETREDYYQHLNSVIDFLKVSLRGVRQPADDEAIPSNDARDRFAPTDVGTRDDKKRVITIDDGCDLVSEIHKNHPELIPHIIGGCEETTTGVIRLRAMEKDNALKYPVVAVNDNKTKHLMDNYYGTGQSTIDGLTRATNLLWAGKTAVVCGYGSCGKGVSLRARGMGSNVIICEIDAFRALQAVMDGFRVMPLMEAAAIGDVFITVTGDKSVLRPEHFQKMKSGTILANAGHFDAEIDLVGLEKMSRDKKRVRWMLDEYTIPSSQPNQIVGPGLVPGRGGAQGPALQEGDGGGVPGRGGVQGLTLQEGQGEDKKVIYVVGEGRLVNLAAAEGHPSEVMSLSFCGQSLACEWLVKQAAGEVGPRVAPAAEVRPRGAAGLEPRVYTLPPEIDERIARLQIEAMGVKIDELTEEQKKYLTSWQEGT